MMRFVGFVSATGIASGVGGVVVMGEFGVGVCGVVGLR
ncbi:hypothetical protein A2U01_0057279, partial [Trifolium medium]|nr:hypothetical protein [Trifolium medium]